MDRWMTLLPGVLYMLVGGFLVVFPARKSNTWYGYRTPRSQRDQESWESANYFAAWGIVVVGFFSANIGLTCVLMHIPLDIAWIIVVVCTAIMSFAGVLATEVWLGRRS